MNSATYFLMVAGILLAKSLGFLRDIVFASTFGASEYTDIYFQIFSLASLIFTGIGTSLATLVIKNLNKPENGGPAQKKAYVAHFITKTVYIVLAVTALLYALAGPLVRMLLPGLSEELYSQALKIMYIMLPSCLFIIVAYIISGVLQNSGTFFITSLISLPYNAVIIATLFFGSSNITTISIVTTIGWFLHIVILLPSFYKKGYRLFGRVQATGDKKGNREILYIFISGMMFQLVFMLDKAFVSSDGGTASMVNYATTFFITVSSVFVVAMSNVSYPSICHHYETGDKEMVNNTLRHLLIILLTIFTIFIVTVCCFGTDIIALLYQRGEFTAEMSQTTGTLFCIYTFGFFGYVSQELFNKILYLDAKYKYTVLGTLAAVLLKLCINPFLKDSVIAVALSTTVIFTIYALCILICLVRTMGNFFNRELIMNIVKVLSAGGVTVALYLTASLIPLPESKLSFALPLLIGAAGYGVTLIATGILKYIMKKPALPKEQ